MIATPPLWTASLQTLGRMFGFTLSSFTEIETITSLGLQQHMVADYKALAGDYFGWVREECGGKWGN